MSEIKAGSLSRLAVSPLDFDFAVSPRACACARFRQGAEKNGRQNAWSALERCVMRRETGLRARDCDTVQKMAAKVV